MLFQNSLDGLQNGILAAIHIDLSLCSSHRRVVLAAALHLEKPILCFRRPAHPTRGRRLARCAVRILDGDLGGPTEDTLGYAGGEHEVGGEYGQEPVVYEVHHVAGTRDEGKHIVSNADEILGKGEVLSLAGSEDRHRTAVAPCGRQLPRQVSDIAQASVNALPVDGAMHVRSVAVQETVPL